MAYYPKLPSQQGLRGFSLLELLIALLLLTVGITTTVQTSWWGLRSSMQTQTEMLVVRGVQEYYMEMLRSKPFDQLVPMTATPGNMTTPVLPGDTSQSSPLEKIPGGSADYAIVDQDPNRKLITIHVHWTDPDGRGRDSNVSTVVTNGGVSN